MITLKKLLQLLLYLCLIIYSLLQWVILPFLFLLSLFKSDLRRQICLQRFQWKNIAAGRVVLFYCSSAGEFEQARPLIDRFKSRGFNPHIVFFSVSGLQFAGARDEGLSMSLAPFDLFGQWLRLYRQIKPEVSIVVRHEFWPAFLTLANARSKLFLINYAPHQDSRSLKFMQGIFLRYFRIIFTIDEVGDTKYDRVLERAAQQKSTALHLREKIRGQLFANKKIIIIGSAWEPDLELVLNALSHLPGKNQFRVIIVPHDVSATNIDKMLAITTKHRFNTVRFSQINETDPLQNREAVLVDSLGKLAELYAVADFCLVGGGLHHRVHNVLEPAAYNLPIAFGPKYHTQAEAVEMAEQGYAKVCSNGEETRAWLEDCLTNAKNFKPTEQFVKQHAGASDKIIQAIFEGLKHG